jgi:prepilin-type N-terminal cleavage/methylation domain-containing protein
VLTRRRGFTLAEVLVGLAIVAILAAVLYPAIGSQLRRGQSAALGNQIGNLRDAIAAYRQNVGRYPRTLSQLSNALGASATDACANTMPPPVRNAWRGPYLTQAVSGDIVVGDATVKDTLVRSPATDAGTAPGTLIIRFINVDSLIAFDVEKNFDPAIDYASGSILWSSAGLDTLKFQILIRNC